VDKIFGQHIHLTCFRSIKNGVKKRKKYIGFYVFFFVNRA